MRRSLDTDSLGHKKNNVGPITRDGIQQWAQQMVSQWKEEGKDLPVVLAEFHWYSTSKWAGLGGMPIALNFLFSEFEKAYGQEAF